MMAQSRAESTRDTYNYGQYINQFLQNTIKVIREFERIQKKICRHKMSIMFNEICIDINMYTFYKYSEKSHPIYQVITICVQYTGFTFVHTSENSVTSPSLSSMGNICPCLPPDRTWHVFFYSEGVGRRREVTSRGSSPAGRMLVIGSFSAMWARWVHYWTWTHSINNVSPARTPAHSLN